MVAFDEELFSLHPYGETDDAVGIVADLVGERRRGGVLRSRLRRDCSSVAGDDDRRHLVEASRVIGPFAR